jgi:biotin operon repressor
MKKLLAFGFVIACAVTAAKSQAQEISKDDPEVCAKVAESLRAGREDVKELAKKLQDEGICSAKQLGL